jgi:hypothetical protein
MDENKYYKMTNPQYVNEISSVYDQMYNNTPKEVVAESCNDTAEVIEEQGRKHGSKYASPAPLDNRPSWAVMLDELRKKKEREDRGPRHGPAEENRITHGGVERETTEEGEETSDQYNKGFDAGYAKGYANGLAQSKG